MPPSEPPVHIVWHNDPPSPAQIAAWDRLWARLLGDIAKDPQTTQPQDLANPGAATFATVSSGHNMNKDTTNDNRITHHRK